VGDSDVVRFFSTLIDRVGELPGVESVGLTSRLPLVSRGVNPNPIYPENAPAYETQLPPLQMFTTVSSDYFRTMRIPLLAGRTFEPMQRQRDGDAIISSTTAKFFWNDSTGESALGKRFRALPTGNWYTVVGVVADARDTTLASAPAPTVYLPETIVEDKATRGVTRTMALAVRTIGEASLILSAAQRVVREMDPALPTFDVGAMTDAVHASTSRLAFMILILGSAAAVTLVLGGVGLYGMLAYMVALRRREFGIRIALGASPRSVIVATTRQGVALTTAGVVTGLVLFMTAARFMRAFLFGVAPWDPLTIASAAFVLLLIAAVTSAIPARRAGRVDPAEVLRAQ
jgi:predicted permease